ncbi:DUF2846 domain-containing protein [Leptospira brenneri]|uniref:DUF2846 domain-containing protein n=1 Tax=Leptospira brenneri TaxID=2023182 RepID=UPI000C29BB74|nr:DUF2846 domain-containing protein [Leptospira brenneri]PJZ43712.1 hypothetical protein CH361_18875 [Leptospira brenneri]
MKPVSFIITFILLLSCKSMQPTGNRFSPILNIDSDKGLVYIYRPKLSTGKVISYIITTDGNNLIELSNGSYKPFFFNPGEVTFEAETMGTASITMDIKKGEVYFLKGNVVVGPLIGKPFLTLVPNEIGEKEISECILKN